MVSTGESLNALVSFFKSRDGQVTIAALVLLAVVSHFSDEYNAWINLLARVGNVCIFLYILWRVAGKKLLASLGSRRSDIAQELEGIAQRRRAAEEQLEELKRRIQGLDAERAAILEESRQQGEAIKASLIAAAEAEAARIREQATRAGDSETKGMIEELRAKMADEIMAEVEAALKGRLNGKTHARLIDKSLKKVVLN